MNKLLGTALIAATMTAVASPALADEMAHESRTVTAQVTKVKLSGVVDLRIKQGPTASLEIWGEPEDLSKVKAVQNGSTLEIDTERRESHWFGKSHKVRADLTVPNLAEFVSQGVGGSDVSGFTGDSIRLSLDGAGSVTLNSRYHNVDATLAGVGGMTLNNMDADRVELNLRGTGHINANGQAKQVRAHMGGLGSLKAQELRADNVDLDISGLGSAKVYAKSAANVSLSGLGSATVYGNPASRHSSSSGMGSVSWR